MTGQVIQQVTLESSEMRACLLSYGAITQGWWYKRIPMILGYDDPMDYLSDRNYLGAIVGRVANRIAGASFALDKALFALDTNEGRITLHGGRLGLSNQHWTIIQVAENEAVLSLNSPDGDCGFPGQAQFELRVTLEHPRLTYSVTAQTDRPTPISIAQHNYYSLGSTIGVSDHLLKLASDRYLDTDDQGIAFGPVSKTVGGAMDFSSAKPIKEAGADLDHFFVFGTAAKQPVAEVTAPNGLKLKLWSDQPGAQIYTGGGLSDPFAPRAGLCIEPSGYPNAPNVTAFPSILCTPERPYRQTLTLEITECAA
ncbi:MAG: aldose epimerase family protein [Pseudomonadota bacterium]